MKRAPYSTASASSYRAMPMSSSSSSSQSGLVPHTWTIHAVSPLACYSLRPTDLEPLLDADLCFGGDYCHLRWFTLDPDDDSSSIGGNNSDDDNDYDDGGERFTSGASSRKRNGHTHTPTVGVNRAGTGTGTGTSNSRYRVLRTDHEILFGPYANLHLFIELFSGDEHLLGSVGFCFVELSRGRIGSLGNFALVRVGSGGGGGGGGSSLSLSSPVPPAVEAVWQWMECKTGCRVSRNAIRPTSELIAASAALWTVQTLADAVNSRSASAPLPSRQRNDGKAPTKRRVFLGSPSAPPGGETARGTAVPFAPGRPLVLTWTPPPDLHGRGIDTCSTVVTPAGLLRLCHDLRALQTWRDGLLVDVGNGAPAMASAAAAGAAAKRSRGVSSSLSSPDRGASGRRFAQVTEPLLATIVNFVSSELAMSLQRFSLSHVTCTVATLGSDGRCKPTSDPHLLQFLAAIRSVVRSLHPPGPDPFGREFSAARMHLPTQQQKPSHRKER